MWQQVWHDYLVELKSPPLVGPGTRQNLSPRLRQALHYLFITFRYLGNYLLLRPIGGLLVFIVMDLKIRNREKLPEGSFIGVSNHLSNFDPLIGALAAGRPVYCMTKAEYFKTPILGGIVIALGGFPVRRGEADRQAVKTAISVAKRGEAPLCIFPEGTRSKTFKLQNAHPGAALIASMAEGVPIVPAAIYGTENIMRRKKFGFLRRPHAEMIIGKPYHLKEEAAAFIAAHNLPTEGKRGRSADLDFYSDIMMLKLAEQLPPEYRGEFTPEGVAERYLARLKQKTAKNEAPKSETATS